MKKSTETKVLFYTLFFASIGILIAGLGPFRSPLLFAFILAFIFYPLVIKIQQVKVLKFLSNRQACLLVTTVMVLILFLLALILIPLFNAEVDKLVKKLPEIGESLQAWLKLFPLYDSYSVYFEKFDLKTFYIENNSAIEKAVTSTFKSADNIFRLAVRFFSFLAFPIFTYYFLSRGDSLKNYLLSIVPQRWSLETRKVFSQVNVTLSQYFRGQLLVASILSVLYCLGFLLIQFPSPFLVGFVSGFLNIIPYFGTGLGVILSMIIVLSQDSLGIILEVFSVFIIVQLLEGYLITPKLVGKSVKLSFFQSILAVIVGGNLFGLWGIILAIPTFSVLKSIMNELQISDV